MASSSLSSTLSCYLRSVPKLPASTSLVPSSLFPFNPLVHNGIGISTRIHAKFEKFQGQENLQDDKILESGFDPDAENTESMEDEEDDSCLPSDLEGAVRQSAQASATFVTSGGMRALVELLIPQLQFLDDEGAQFELWELSRVFLNTLMEETGIQRVKAIFPDAGATALLQYKWKDSAFGFSSLGDRKPVESEDEIVVLIVPDHQMLEYVRKIASELSDDPPRPLIMWNPSLVSGDVGVGINVRRLRRDFLSTFTVVYSMKPLQSGAVFRCYPGLWKVFYDDKDRPNRYLLAQEMVRRPDAEDLEIIYGSVEENQEKGTSLFDQAAGIFSSFNRFMRVISK